MAFVMPLQRQLCLVLALATQTLAIYRNMTITSSQLLSGISNLESAVVFQDTILIPSVSRLLIHQYHIPSGALLRMLSGHMNSISDLFVEQGNVFSVSGTDGALQWNLTSPSSADNPLTPSSKYLVQQFTLDGTIVTAASAYNQSLYLADGNRITQFNLPSGQVVSRMNISGATISAMLAMDGFIIVNTNTAPIVYSFPGGIRVFMWNPSSGNSSIPLRNGDVFYASSTNSI
jgi:hypothetical protein